MKKASLSASSVALKGSSDTELALKQSRLFHDYNAGALDSGNLGNPNGLHEESRQAASVLSHARARVARLVGASPGEIFFFPSASLANYFLITSFARVCCSPYEHPSVYKSISEFDSENPTLVSAMLANNETG
jgi:cysteine sulfinate desulfinase/cysteine desulfurase-like protein